eukprot:15215375-Alexandrium_andersonii.AAC.1
MPARPGSRRPRRPQRRAGRVRSAARTLGPSFRGPCVEGGDAVVKVLHLQADVDELGLQAPRRADARLLRVPDGLELLGAGGK